MHLQYLWSDNQCSLRYHRVLEYPKLRYPVPPIHESMKRWRTAQYKLTANPALTQRDQINELILTFENPTLFFFLPYLSSFIPLTHNLLCFVISCSRTPLPTTVQFWEGFLPGFLSATRAANRSISRLQSSWPSGPWVKMMETFSNETDSDYTSYWKDWVSAFSRCLVCS